MRCYQTHKQQPVVLNTMQTKSHQNRKVFNALTVYLLQVKLNLEVTYNSDKGKQYKGKEKKQEECRGRGTDEQNNMDEMMKAGCLARNAGKCNIYRVTETVTCIWTRHKLTKNLVLAEVRLFETERHSMNMK